MKLSCILLLFLFTLNANSQNTAINYTDGRYMQDAVIIDSNIYIGTEGGLLKYNKITEEKTYYNRGNSNIPCNNVTAIAKDTNGLLWVGTVNRLSSFDGTNWIWYDINNSGLTDNYIRSLFVDSQNNLWVGTNMIQKFDGLTWTNYNNATTGMNSWWIYDITEESNGNMWFATDVGILKYNGTTWIQHYGAGSTYTYSLVFDLNGTLWAGTASGLYRLNANQTWTVFNQSNTGMLLNNSILELAVDVNNILYIGTDNGLNKMQDYFWYRYSTFFGGLYPMNHIECIVADDDGYTYVMPTDYIIKNKGLGYLNYTSSNSGLQNNQTVCIAAHPNGEILYGTASQGAGKKVGTNWTVYNSGNLALPANTMVDVSIDSAGHYWFATNWFGIAKYDGISWTFFDTSDGLADNTVYDIHCNTANSKVYFSTGVGLSEFDGTNWTTYTTSNSLLSSNYVYGMANDSLGNMYFGTFGQFAKFDGSNWTVYNLSNSGFPNDGIRDMNFDSQGNLWITTYLSGLVKFDGITCTTFNSSNSNLDNDQLYHFAIDQNDNLFIAMNGSSMGVRKFDGVSFTNLSSGLNSTNVKDVTVDNENTVWYATQGGIAKYNPAIIITDRGTSNSGIWNNFVYDVEHNAPSGKTWMGTRDGIVSFDGHTWESLCYDSTNILYDWTNSVKEDLNGFVYAGGFYGLSVYDGNTFTNFTNASTGVNIDGVNDIEVDSLNNKWLATTGGGLIRFTNSVQQTYTMGNSSIPGNTVSCVKIDTHERKLWMGVGSGTASYDGTNWIYYDTLYKQFSSYSVTDIDIDENGVKWFATNHGVVKFDNVNWTGYNMSNTPILPTDIIYDIDVDLHGNVWAGTQFGLLKFDGISWNHYTVENSNLTHNICQSISSDEYGNLWYSGSNDGAGFGGIEIFNPSGITLPPVANFNADIIYATVGEMINFTDLSQNNPTSWNWEFHGANALTSTQQNPTGIFYNTPGCYSVKLIASNAIGIDSLEKICYIQIVDSIPIADFNADNLTVSINDPVQFFDLSTNNPISFNWTFIGGNPSGSTLQSPIVTYGATGCYEVSLTVTNSGGTDSETKTCYIDVINTNNLSDLNSNIFKIYPNPFIDQIQINTETNFENTEFVLYNTLGEIVFTSELNKINSILMIKNISSGIYFYTMKSENKILQSGKIAKK